MMQDDLLSIINKLETQVSKDEATIGIFQIGNDADESCIKANKEGLLVFASALLKAAEKMNETSGHEQASIPIATEEPWYNKASDTVIHYIEPVSLNFSDTPDTQSIIERILPWGCLLLFLLFVVSAIIGLQTLVKWIF